jgi:hypothetical protein
MASFFPCFPYNLRPRPSTAQPEASLTSFSSHSTPTEEVIITISCTLAAPSINRFLPNEVLTEIFSYAPLDNGSLDTSAGLWVLSRVCKRWRSICHSTPLLWSSVSILSTDTHTLSKQSIRDTISTVLRLSNPCPLHLSFVSKPDSIEPGFDLALQLLLQASHRWESVSFHVQGFVGQLQVAEDLMFPRLRSIDIFSPSQRVNFAAPILPVLMRGAKSLRAVSLQSAAVTLPRLTDEMREIWRGVEELTLHVSSFTPDGPLDILRSTPLLRSCSLSQHVPFTSVSGSPPPHHHHQHQHFQPSAVVLNNLTSLDLSTSRMDLLTTYLRILSLPSLECISIHAPGFSGTKEEILGLERYLPGLGKWLRRPHIHDGFTAVDTTSIVRLGFM